MSNWSDWLDWGGRPAPVRSLNNLYGPTSMGTPYQWLRPPGAPFPTPSGAQFPMFSPAGSPNYPMFGPNAGVPNVSVGAGPMPAMSWAERVATAGYSPATSTSPLVPMFDAAGNPSSIPRPMFDAAGNPTPITQTYSPGPGVPARPQVPGGATQFKTPLVPNQPSLMPNASPMNLANPTRVPMFDAAGNLNPIPGGGSPYTPGPGVPTNPYVQAGASTAAKYPMFDAAGNPAPGPVRVPQPPSSMGPNARPMFGAGSGRPTTPPPGTAPTPVNVPPPPAATSTAGVPGSGPLNPPPPMPGSGPNSPPPPPPGNLYTRRAAANAAAGGTPAPGAAPTPGTTPGAGGSPTPGAAAAATPGRWNAFRTSTFGPSFTPKSSLGDLFTKNMTGKGAVGANIGMQVALQALPRLTAQYLPGITGRPLTEQGVETARSSAGLAGLGAMFGVPVGAAAGVGGFLGDAIGSSGGLGVANFLRENMPEWMPGDVEKQGPTDDTIGDILGRAPVIGGWFSDNGDPAQQAQDPVAALPPTPESIATVGQMAGLDPSSTGFLQQQFNNSVMLSMAQYTADPEGFKKQFEAVHGRPMESEADIAQVLFSKIVSESLPAALENQSAQAAALQNAAMYQDFISKYMAPIRDQYNDLGARASAAGYGDLALQFQGQGVSQESAIRMIPSLEALRAKQSQVDQLAQQQYQSMMSGGGATSDPLGDAATLASLGLPTG